MKTLQTLAIIIALVGGFLIATADHASAADPIKLCKVESVEMNMGNNYRCVNEKLVPIQQSDTGRALQGFLVKADCGGSGSTYFKLSQYRVRPDIFRMAYAQVTAGLLAGKKVIFKDLRFSGAHQCGNKSYFNATTVILTDVDI